MTLSTTVYTTVYTTVDSPLGQLLLVGEESATAPGGIALASLSLPGQKGGAQVQDGWQRDDAAFAEPVAQLEKYFAGEPAGFALETTVRGTDFQRRVWAALEAIPYGTVTTYRQIAEQAGSPAAVRAVGAAIGANPLLIVRPCHRVIGANGSLTGYAGGLPAKQHLLALEGVRTAA
ncbi:cysteine methyltransferase [Kitasatospora sp. MMS16-BH015]|uniref:methylated-DNA--[protein]-cysteine S-methyltransferase n=1 Tax=Kitasatospora sp. MMS16-BH015 TaxID=2018025 RepID=UPI000CA33683|nr:methylated-DNA--[protein]-cysteine S-methyltransferase [Kitasatospora sp. MMS16-BH015]AUG77911.1 cysteine methyltransferase [Kitasatospora sp. MMS16-BH015]